MKNIVMYAHGGSENHGCEAIIRSSAKLLKNNKKPLLLSYDKNQDMKYGVNELVDVKQGLNSINKKSFDFIKAYFYQKVMKNYHYMDSLMHKEAIDALPQMDISLFVGGDNYCYSDVKNYAVINQYMRNKTKKMVLWGTSVEPELLKNEIIRKDIQQYDMIFSRESISYNALKQVNPNTYLYPDPAFFLPVEEVELPKGFECGNMVGINMSPLIISHEKNEGQAFKNYDYLVNYILQNTNYSIALIPHVVWKSNDDRKPLQILFDKYKDTGRVILVDDHNCMQQKYIISQCKFLVGARTHATIAAYSTCVPTLVVGYSVKARGIARDLFGTEENYVLPVQQLVNEDDLTNAFKWIVDHEEEMKKQLELRKEEYSKLEEVYAKELYE